MHLVHDGPPQAAAAAAEGVIIEHGACGPGPASAPGLMGTLRHRGDIGGTSHHSALRRWMSPLASCVGCAPRPGL